MRVLEVQREADGVVSIELGSNGASALPACSPGAHIDVILPNGLVRQYSLCGLPEDRTRWRIGSFWSQRGAAAPRSFTATCGQAMRCRWLVHATTLRSAIGGIPVHRRRDRNHSDFADGAPRRRVAASLETAVWRAHAQVDGVPGRTDGS